jgi:hypothetical protein
MVSLSLLKAFGINYGKVWQTLSQEKLAGTFYFLFIYIYIYICLAGTCSRRKTEIKIS